MRCCGVVMSFGKYVNDDVFVELFKQNLLEHITSDKFLDELARHLISEADFHTNGHRIDDSDVHPDGAQCSGCYSGDTEYEMLNDYSSSAKMVFIKTLTQLGLRNESDSDAADDSDDTSSGTSDTSGSS